MVHQERLLLVQRGREPARGEWAIPGGKVAPGESLAAATAREVMEETGISVEVGKLAWHFEFIERDEAGALRFHYVVLDFYARYIGGEPVAGDDAAAVRWVGFDGLPGLQLNALTQRALHELFPDKVSLR